MPDDMNDIQLGYFGKCPGYRDFVQRGLPVRFIDRWRHWIASVMDTGAEQLGDEWLDVYLTSPVWRFAVRDHELGEGIWLGALMPSVDARQRYFPICVVVCLPPEPLFQLLRRSEPFLTSLEEAMIAILHEPFLDSTEIAQHFDALWHSSATDCLYEVVKLDENTAQDSQALQELDRFVACANDPVGIWHAAKVASGNECLRVMPSLPDPLMFVKLQQATMPMVQPQEDMLDDEEKHSKLMHSSERIVEQQ